MRRHLSLVAAGLLSAGSGHPLPDILVADFEQQTYEDWTTEGDAFGSGPARGTLPGQMPGRSIRYDVPAQKLNEAPLKSVDGMIHVQVLADRSLTEIVGNDGRVYISADGPVRMEPEDVSVTAEGGAAHLVSLEAHELKSIWE